RRSFFLLAADDLAQLEDRDDRQEANEQEEAGEDEADRAVENPFVPDRAAEGEPLRRHVIMRKAGDDEAEALEPHADHDADRQQPQDQLVPPYRRYPQKLRQRDV